MNLFEGENQGQGQKMWNFKIRKNLVFLIFWHNIKMGK